LIIIPVLRGFFHALGGDFADWMAGSWIDIAILLAMTGFSILRWRRTFLWWDENLLRVRSGLIFRGEVVIPWEKVVTVCVADSFYLRPLGAVRLRADTLGGSERNADFSILIAPEQARLLLETHGGLFSWEKGFAPSARSILAMSILNSNSLGGIIFIAAFISQGGKLLGQEFSSEVVGAFEQISRTLAFGLPPAAAAIAYLLLGGWAVSFLLTFTRYKNMRVNVRNGCLHIRGGLITKRSYSVAYDKVNYLDIRQSLTTRLLGLHSLYIAAVGYAKRKEDISCLIPTEGRRVFEGVRTQVFPGLIPLPRALAPVKKGAARFVMLPACICLGILLLTVFVMWTMEGWASFILFAGGMAIVPALYFLAVRVADFYTGGIAQQGGVYTLCYSRGFYLHTVVARREKIVQTELRQSFLQRTKGRCDLILHSRAEGRRLHRLRNLPLQNARDYVF